METLKNKSIQIDFLKCMPRQCATKRHFIPVKK